MTTHGAPVWARVVEPRRAVAIARHYREAEGLSIAQIADRLGRSPATVKAYFYDPAGEKARAVKARYQGVVSRLRRVHPAANGKGDAYAHCKDAFHARSRRYSSPLWRADRLRRRLDRPRAPAAGRRHQPPGTGPDRSGHRRRARARARRPRPALRHRPARRPVGGGVCARPRRRDPRQGTRLRERMARKLRDALPGGKGGLRAAMWQ